VYDTSEQGQRQYRRVVGLIWGLYILIPVMFLMMGCSVLEPSHDCEILGGDSVNGFEVGCPEYRQDPIKHEEQEYLNRCKNPLNDEECVLVA